MKKWATQGHTRQPAWQTDPSRISVEKLLHLPITPIGPLLRSACFPPMTQPAQDNDTSTEPSLRWGDIRHSARFRARVLEGIDFFLGEADGTFNRPPSHLYHPHTQTLQLRSHHALSPQKDGPPIPFLVDVLNWMDFPNNLNRPDWTATQGSCCPCCFWLGYSGCPIRICTGSHCSY